MTMRVHVFPTFEYWSLRLSLQETVRLPSVFDNDFSPLHVTAGEGTFACASQLTRDVVNLCIKSADVFYSVHGIVQILKPEQN